MPTLAIVPQPRPKILSVITVPTGGWTIKVYISVGSQYDTAITATMDAGDYFLSGDNQDDDFLYELGSEMNKALIASQGGTARMHITVTPSTGKVTFWFEGPFYNGAISQDVKIAWTENDGSTLGGILGFDTSADLTLEGSDYPTTTGGWQHAYGWYADADGYLAESSPVDWDEPTALQAVTPLGHATTHYIGARKRNSVRLQHIPNVRMWSNDQGYTDTPLHPYEKNIPLECWWQEARQGKRFRFYFDGQLDTTRDVEGGTSTGYTYATGYNTADATMTDSARSWDTDPQEHKGRLLHAPGTIGGANTAVPFTSYIVSHTASVLTLANDWQTWGWMPKIDADQYHIIHQPYGTYVVDLNQMKEFRPTEIPHIDEYNLTIPLIKYQA